MTDTLLNISDELSHHIGKVVMVVDDGVTYILGILQWRGESEVVRLRLIGSGVKATTDAGAMYGVEMCSSATLTGDVFAAQFTAQVQVEAIRLARQIANE